MLTLLFVPMVYVERTIKIANTKNAKIATTAKAKYAQATRNSMFFFFGYSLPLVLPFSNLAASHQLLKSYLWALETHKETKLADLLVSTRKKAQRNKRQKREEKKTTKTNHMSTQAIRCYYEYGCCKYSLDLHRETRRASDACVKNSLSFTNETSRASQTRHINDGVHICVLLLHRARLQACSEKKHAFARKNIDSRKRHNKHDQPCDDDDCTVDM